MAEYDGEIRINTMIHNGISSQMAKINKDIEKATRKSDELIQSMKKMESQKIPTEEYKNVSDGLHRANIEFDKLLQRQDVMREKGKTSGTTWNALDKKIESVGEDIRSAERYLNQMKKEGTAFEKIKETDKYKKLSSQLKEVNSQLEILNKKKGEQAKKELLNIGKAADKSAGVLSNFVSRLKGITLSLLFFNWITKGFNAMVSAFKDGVQSMAKYSSDFNGKMSEMQSATNNLKASIGTLAVPILTALTPAIVTLCGWLTNVINAINKFVSAVSGKSTWTMAKKQQTDYAKSLDGTASAAKKAAGALASFDDLNVLQSKDDSSTAGKGSGSTTDYEEVPLTEKDFAWVDRMKELFAGILTIAIAIGATLLTWKAVDFLTTLMAINPILGIIASVIAVVAGAVLAVASYFQMWKDGVDWEGLAGLIGGVSLAVAGLYILFGPIVAGITLIISAIAGLILAVKDIVENGLTAENMVLLLISTFGAIAGVFMAFGGPAAVVVGAIVGIIAVILLLRDKFEMIKSALEELWNNNIKTFVENIIAGVESLKSNFVEFWNTYVSPILDKIGEKFEDMVNNHIQPMVSMFIGLIGSIIDVLGLLWKEVLVPIINWIVSNILPIIVPILGAIVSTVMDVASGIADVITGIMQIMKGIIDWIIGVFTGDWERAFGGLSDIISGFWNTIKGVINMVIGGIESMANGVIGAINGMITALNKIKFDVPDWVPEIGGKSLGFNISKISTISIPRLANGGITTGSTIANIGEAGREAVLPLENNTGWMDDFASRLVEKMNPDKPIILMVDGKRLAQVSLPYLKGESYRLGLDYD